MTTTKTQEQQQQNKKIKNSCKIVYFNINISTQLSSTSFQSGAVLMCVLVSFLSFGPLGFSLYGLKSGLNSIAWRSIPRDEQTTRAPSAATQCA